MRVVDPASTTFMNVDFTYTITTDQIVGLDTLVKISVKADDYFSEKQAVEAVVRLSAGGFIPSSVKAAISTNNDIGTLGTLIVDGREHDLDGNVILNGTGTLGIWTTQGFDQGGNSAIGGTYGGSDYTPWKPGASNIISTDQTYPGGYPDTPDKVLGGTDNGYPEGTLISIAKSGINGSQYITDASQIKLPLSGVTYVDLPYSGGKQVPSIKMETLNGSGIFIVHNSAGNAKIENINGGTFKGLLIADDIVHIHCNILGAVIGLTPTPSEGNCIGNGSGTIMYSSAAISMATSLGKIRESKYGYGKHRLPIEKYYEMF